MRILVLLSAAALTAAVFTAAGKAEAPVEAQTPPPGEGFDIIQARCAGCHPLSQVFGAPPKTAQGWAQTVRKMAERNGEMTPEEITTVNAYLALHFASDAPLTAAAPSPAPVANP